MGTGIDMACLDLASDLGHLVMLQVKKRVVPVRSWGYWHAESNFQLNPDGFGPVQQLELS